MSLVTPTLVTERLRLRPVEDEDAGFLWELMSAPFVLRYWDEPPWRDPSRAQRFVDQSRSAASEGSGARVLVERAQDGERLGWCGVSSWDPAFRSAELTLCFGQASWGHGHATEAGAALLDWAYATLDLNRVQAMADTRNIACGRVLHKLGFVLEGTLREDCVVDGVVSDSWVFGLLARDRT